MGNGKKYKTPLRLLRSHLPARRREGQIKMGRVRDPKACALLHLEE